MRDLIKKLLRETLDYKGEHSAPDKDDTPIYDMTQTLPDDIYSNDAVRLYGEHSDEYSDQYSIHIIHSVRNKPKAKVKIYRAVPDLNYDVSKKIKELSSIISYKNQFGFYPMKNKIVNDLDAKYYDSISDYDKRMQQIYNDIETEINNLSAQKSKGLTINNGDWVTINPDYAKSHGRNNLNNKFKIITKTVPANTLFTFGDSIHEWGYNEGVNEGINEGINEGVNLAIFITDSYIIIFDKATLNFYGVATYEKIENGLYHIPAMGAEKGYGFYLFNIILTLINPDYLIADRDSSTSALAVKMLNRIYQDPNIEHITLKPTDKNYFHYPNESSEYNAIVNTKFRIKKPLNVSKMLADGKAIMAKQKIRTDKLNDKAFDYFSNKLG